MIHESGIEYCLIAKYANGDKFCMAKFMHEEDARAWQEQQEPKEWVAYRLYKRYGGDEVRWEPLGKKG